MAATAQPNIGTKEGYATGDNGWVGDFNFLNRAIDGLVQASVKAIQAAPPGSPVRGDCYIVATGGSGAWSGWDGRFVRYTGSAWESWIAKDGWYVYNQADATAYRRKSGAWQIDDFLAKNNPTFTGTLTGPKASLEDFGVLRDRTSNPAHGALYPTGVTPGTSNYAMLIYDDGTITALQASSSVSLAIGVAPKLTATASAVNIGASTALQMNGVDVIDSSRNGSFAGLTASGTISGPRATLSEFGVLREYTGGSAIGALYPTGVTPNNSNHAIALYDNGTELALNAGTQTTVSVGAINKLTVTASAANLGSGVELQQNGTTRITAGGDGRFASLRGTDLANTDSSAVFADANGNLQKTPHLSLSLVNGPQFGARVVLVSAFYNGTSGYLATSLRMGPDDVAESNDPLGVESGDFWNSKRYHAIGIADGAVGARYLGRIRADRWTGTSLVSVSGTTSATSWFAAGTGAGSPTLPANYLQGGRRVRAKGRVSCQSCAADTAPEFAFKIGSTTIKTQAKAFTIAGGNAIYVDFDVDFWADGDGFLVAVGDIKFSSPAIGGTYEYKINYAGAYDGSTAKTIDATIKPSSAAETWARNLAFIEA